MSLGNDVARSVGAHGPIAWRYPSQYVEGLGQCYVHVPAHIPRRVQEPTLSDTLLLKGSGEAVFCRYVGQIMDLSDTGTGGHMRMVGLRVGGARSAISRLPLPRP